MFHAESAKCVQILVDLTHFYAIISISIFWPRRADNLLFHYVHMTSYLRRNSTKETTSPTFPNAKRGGKHVQGGLKNEKKENDWRKTNKATQKQEDTQHTSEALTQVQRREPRQTTKK